MVGPQDGGFGFDQSKKYTSVDNIDQVCVQCQAGQHKKCLVKSKQQENCECEHCLIYGWCCFLKFIFNLFYWAYFCYEFIIVDF